MERMTGPNDYSPTTPSSSNKRDPPATSQKNEVRIDQIAAQLQ